MTSYSNLFLVGYRGSGKTTVAKCVARRLGWGCVDTDQWVESQAAKTIRDIFEHSGEVAFRDWETQAIDACSRASHLVIALGGGAVLREANRQMIGLRGQCVWLKASAEVLYQRIAADSRTATTRPSLSPLSGYDEIVHLLSQREPLYRNLANFSVETDGRSPDELAEEIVAWWRQLT